MKTVAEIAEELRGLSNANDTSPPALARLVEALGSDATWFEENPYYDGLSARGWESLLWEVARRAIASLGDPAIDAVVARIREGDAKLLARGAQLGPPIVAEAMLILERGPAPMMAAAQEVLRQNAELFGAADAVVNFLLGFDAATARHTDDMLVDLWPTLATPEGRQAIETRWSDGGLRTWIEARITDDAWRVRHVVALLAIVPLGDAIPLLRRALATIPVSTAFEPLIVIDVTRAKQVLDAADAVRADIRPIALRIARGGFMWESNTRDQPRDHALLAAFAGDAEVWEGLIKGVEKKARGHQDVWEPEWLAVAAHVREDLSQLDRAIAATIRAQLNARAPGVPHGRIGIARIGAIDPARMLAAIADAQGEIAESKNKWCFEQATTALAGAAR